MTDPLPPYERVPRPLGPVPGAGSLGGGLRPGRVRRPAGLKLKDHEILTAYRIASLGIDVEFQPNPHGFKTPDALIRNDLWEFKKSTGTGPSTIVDQLRNAHEKAAMAVLDLVDSPLALPVVLRQIRRYWRRPGRLNYLERVWVLPHTVDDHFTLERPR